MALRWYGVVVDAADPVALGLWWAKALGFRVLADGVDEIMIGQGLDEPPCLLFVRGTDQKWGKNRLHLELAPDDQEEEVARLVRLGARPTDIGQGETTWTVLADPEGNEFCVLRGAGG